MDFFSFSHPSYTKIQFTNFQPFHLSIQARCFIEGKLLCVNSMGERMKANENDRKKGKKSIPFIKIKVIAFSCLIYLFNPIQFENRNSNWQLIKICEFHQKIQSRHFPFHEPIKMKFCLMIYSKKFFRTVILVQKINVEWYE